MHFTFIFRLLWAFAAFLIILVSLDCTGGIVWITFLIIIFVQDSYGVESTGNPTENSDGTNNYIYEWLNRPSL